MAEALFTVILYFAQIRYFTLTNTKFSCLGKQKTLEYYFK